MRPRGHAHTTLDLKRLQASEHAQAAQQAIRGQQILGLPWVAGVPCHRNAERCQRVQLSTPGPLQDLRPHTSKAQDLQSGSESVILYLAAVSARTQAKPHESMCCTSMLQINRLVSRRVHEARW